MREIHLLVIHHSASPRSTSREQINRWHHDRGFAGIGYHWVVEQDGALLAGRPIAMPGAHAQGYNRESFGICVTGDNTKPGEEWNTAQQNTLAQFVRWFLVFYPGAQVMGHRDLHGTATQCPGTDVRQLLRELGALTGGG